MSKCLQSMLLISHFNIFNWFPNGTEKPKISIPDLRTSINLSHSYEHLVLQEAKHGLYEISMHVINTSNLNMLKGEINSIYDFNFSKFDMSLMSSRFE